MLLFPSTEPAADATPSLVPRSAKNLWSSKFNKIRTMAYLLLFAGAVVVLAIEGDLLSGVSDPFYFSHARLSSHQLTNSYAPPRMYETVS